MPNLITADVATEVSLVATSGQTVFSFNFVIFETSDLVVTVNGSTVTPVSISGVGDSAGGSVTLTARSAGDVVKLVRRVPVKRSIDIPTSGPFASEIIDDEFDRIFAIAQELRTETNNATEEVEALAEVVDDAEALALAIVQSTALTVTSATGQTVSTVGLLAGISAPVNGQTAYLTQSGREGLFQFSTANLSASVTADTYQGIYVAPAAASSGASGAWVRIVEGNLYEASWFGVSAAAGNNVYLNLQSAVNNIPEGATLRLPPETITPASPNNTYNFAALKINKPMRLTGHGAKTVWTPSHDQNSTPIVVLASNVEIDNFKMTNFRTTGGSDQRSCVTFQCRFYYTDHGVDITDCSLHDMIFDGVSSAVIIAYQPWENSGGTTVNWTPKRIRVYRNSIFDCDYQAIRPEGDDIEIFENLIVMNTAIAARAQLFPFRVLGCDNVNIHHNTIYNRPDVPCFSIQNAGIGGSIEYGPPVEGTSDDDFRDARNVFIHHNRVYGGLTFCEVQDPAEQCVIADNSFESHTGLTGTSGTAAMSFVTSVTAVRQATIIVRNNLFRGVSTGFVIVGNYKTIKILDNELISNSSMPGVANFSFMLEYRGNLGTVDKLVFKGNSMSAYGNGFGWPIYLNQVSGGRCVIEDNMVPEAINTPAYQAAVMANSPTGGTIRTSNTGSFIALSALANDFSTDGSNKAWPTGAHATEIANIAVSPRTVR